MSTAKACQACGSIYEWHLSNRPVCIETCESNRIELAAAQAGSAKLAQDLINCEHQLEDAQAENERLQKRVEYLETQFREVQTLYTNTDTERLNLQKRVGELEGTIEFESTTGTTALYWFEQFQLLNQSFDDIRADEQKRVAEDIQKFLYDEGFWHASNEIRRKFIDK